MSEPSAQRGRRVAVATVGEIPVGGRKIVEVDERSIGVFHLDDGYVARTGRSWVDPDRTRVRSYPVTTDGERIVIHL
ncbi:hypothetical protein HOP40_33355 [Pseudonocardia broussonetiae]|uniref:Uncharacterized protein n=1 Tax=Pseudonocardia broussonetiae TaxID=2736640 RepID=A0A6M6JUB7_9PSEU|nr:hypothetical protein HOP40_33355 [Pseudonocardia broussonetiae]